MRESKLTIAVKKGWLINARDDNGREILESVENELALRDERIEELEAKVDRLTRES